MIHIVVKLLFFIYKISISSTLGQLIQSVPLQKRKVIWDSETYYIFRIYFTIDSILPIHPIQFVFLNDYVCKYLQS